MNPLWANGALCTRFGPRGLLNLAWPWFMATCHILLLLEQPLLVTGSHLRLDHTGVCKKKACRPNRGPIGKLPLGPTIQEKYNQIYFDQILAFRIFQIHFPANYNLPNISVRTNWVSELFFSVWFLTIFGLRVFRPLSTFFWSGDQTRPGVYPDFSG